MENTASARGHGVHFGIHPGRVERRIKRRNGIRVAE